MLFYVWVYNLFGIVAFYDLVHFHFSEPVSVLRKLPFMLWARMWKKKAIAHFHAFSPDTTIHSRFRWAYQYMFGKADIVITLSEYWQREVVDEFGLGEDKVRVVYNPCTAQLEDRKRDAHLYADSDVSMPCKYRILYAGTVNARKGYEDMIRAFAKIAGRHKDWMIVFAGNGEIERGADLAKELGISGQVLFLGWVSGEDKVRVFCESTVFCLPSYAEGFPMAVLDAWSYGLPVITTPVGGIPDVADDGNNLLLFNPGGCG